MVVQAGGPALHQTLPAGEDRAWAAAGERSRSRRASSGVDGSRLRRANRHAYRAVPKSWVQ